MLRKRFTRSAKLMVCWILPILGLILQVGFARAESFLIMEQLKGSLSTVLPMVPGEHAKAVSIYLDIYRPFDQQKTLGEENKGVVAHFADLI
jgi:hypothetical protein